VLSDLVVIKGGLVLAALETLLDVPPGPGDPNQFGQRRAAGRKALVVGQLAGSADRPADQQVVVRSAGPDERPIVGPVALGAGPARQPLPGPFRDRAGELVGADLLPGPGPDAVVAEDCQHVAKLLGLQEGPQRPVVAVGLITGYPPKRRASRHSPRDHHLGQLRFRGEPPLGWDPGGRAPTRVGEPARQSGWPKLLPPRRPSSLASCSA
jgi:hypothetical protein